MLSSSYTPGAPIVLKREGGGKVISKHVKVSYNQALFKHIYITSSNHYSASVGDLLIVARTNKPADLVTGCLIKTKRK